MSERHELGERLKRARLAKNLTLKQVEREAKVSATHISEIERGMTSPTVGALSRIARALGGEAADFVRDDVRDPVWVTRAASRPSLRDVQSGATLRSLGGGMRGDELSFIEIELLPERDARLPVRHAGEELCHVIRGVIELTIADSRHLLKEGDSIHFRGSGGHAIRNIGDGVARVLLAATPAVRL